MASIVPLCTPYWSAQSSSIPWHRRRLFESCFPVSWRSIKRDNAFKQEMYRCWIVPSGASAVARHCVSLILVYQLVDAHNLVV